MFQSLGKYDKAKEYLHKALVITTEIGDRNGEGACYANLGNVFQSLGEYERAKEYLHKALVIITEIGDRNAEGKCYADLGSVFHSGLKSLSTKRLSSELKLATEEEKHHVMET